MAISDFYFLEIWQTWSFFLKKILSTSRTRFPLVTEWQKFTHKKEMLTLSGVFISGDFFPAGEFLFFKGQKSVLSKVSNCQMSKSFIGKSPNSM
jgi:hypothetical protein